MTALIVSFIPFAFGVFLYFIGAGKIIVSKENKNSLFKQPIVQSIITLCAMGIMLLYGIKFLFALFNYFT